MTETSWFDTMFSICDHGLVRGYCAGCTAADEEDEARRKDAGRARALESENARLRRLLQAHGIEGG